MTEGIHEVFFKIKKINGDKSGLIIGITDASVATEPSLDNASNSVAINAAGFE